MDQQHIVLDDVSWDFYEHLLKEVGDRPIRITYDSGRIEIMAPLNLHEAWKKRIDILVQAMCEERHIKAIADGSTTFKSRLLEKGLEPDECYYVQHADQVRSKTTRDLIEDPPPDLALEIDITSRSIDREPIYAAFGVPELWRFDANGLTVLQLDSSGKYLPNKSSRVFPFLPIDEFRKYLDQFDTAEDKYDVVRAFRQWVRNLP